MKPSALKVVRNMTDAYKSEHEKQLEKILETWARWQRALQEKKRIFDECKESETAAAARFKDEIEKGLDATADKADVVSAHFATVTEWGVYQDCVAGCKEAKKAAREVVADSAALMSEAIAESKQTVLNFDAGPEDDDDDADV